jgi:hypothetical protein
VDEHDEEAQSFVAKFAEYAESHLSGNEADAVDDTSKGKARQKMSTLKPDLTFTQTMQQEPMLPQDCLDLKLEEKKHLFRCFLKSQYGESSLLTKEGIILKMRFQGLAKGTSYPGSRCTPPWAKLAESPDQFFDVEDLPEVEYDEGRKKVSLQDPSRMKNHELNACLRLWRDRQQENKPSFQFHHWWSEGQKEFVPANEPKQLDSDEDEDRDALTNPPAKRNGKRKPQGNEKHLDRKNKKSSGTEEVSLDTRDKVDISGKTSVTKMARKKQHVKKVKRVGL